MCECYQIGGQFIAEDPDCPIHGAERIRLEQIVAIMRTYTQEMEGDHWYGSHPGISEDDYEDIAEEIIELLGR